jgi:hypothetical protein
MSVTIEDFAAASELQRSRAVGYTTAFSAYRTSLMVHMGSAEVERLAQEVRDCLDGIMDGEVELRNLAYRLVHGD